MVYWKNATSRISAHEGGKCHNEAVLKTVTLPATTRNVGDSLSTQTADDKRAWRQCLLKIVSNLKFLARQGIPLPGDGNDSDLNFVQYMTG